MNIGANWADALGQEAREVNHEPQTRRPWAEVYPAEANWINTSTFGFAAKMRDVLQRWEGLTPGQLAAVRKCMAYAAPKSAPVALPSRPVSVLDLRNVPSGMYADPDGSTRLKVKIQHGTGKWDGWIFVSDGAAYGRGTRYGAQKPGSSGYVGGINDVIVSIVKNPAAASGAYGRLTGTCGICGRPLENEDSVERGIGPICAGRLGW